MDPICPNFWTLLTCSIMSIAVTGPRNLPSSQVVPLPNWQTPIHSSGLSLEFTTSRKPSLTFPEVGLDTPRPSCSLRPSPSTLCPSYLLVVSPLDWKLRAWRVPVSLFHMPVLKAPRSFIRSFAQGITLCGSSRLG